MLLPIFPCFANQNFGIFKPHQDKKNYMPSRTVISVLGEISRAGHKNLQGHYFKCSSTRPTPINPPSDRAEKQLIFLTSSWGTSPISGLNIYHCVSFTQHTFSIWIRNWTNASFKILMEKNRKFDFWLEILKKKTYFWKHASASVEVVRTCHGEDCGVKVASQDSWGLLQPWIDMVLKLGEPH